MSEIISLNIPTSVTVSCPLKKFQQRYLHKGCLHCEYFSGIELLTDAIEKEIRDPVTGITTGMRPIDWHEKHMIRCAYPMTRRCTNMAIVEE